MLRAFFVIFLLCTIAVIAVFGFRGRKSTQPPQEIFPDMVRQPKVRAQAPLEFFSDGRGPRLPVAGTVPIGYEMPARNTSRGDAAGQKPQPVETQQEMDVEARAREVIAEVAADRAAADDANARGRLGHEAFLP